MESNARRHLWLRGALVGVFLVSLLHALAARADFSDVVARIKPSIVAVGTYLPTRSPQFQFRGTGFIVGNGNLAATNSHVLPDVLESNESIVIVVPGEGRVGVHQAQRYISDPDHDLHVLRFDGPPLPAVKFGDSMTVRDGQDIAFTGFPLGAALGLAPVTHRGIISALTPVGQPAASSTQLDARLVRRLAAGSFQVFQLDAVSYPGNSGSPLYDVRSGEVVGVLNMTFVKGSKEAALTNPSAISYAIPAQYLKALIANSAAD
jgi:S1-C subfamily serine protease